MQYREITKVESEPRLAVKYAGYIHAYWHLVITDIINQINITGIIACLTLFQS